LLPRGTREKRGLADLKGMEMITTWRGIARSNYSREGSKGMINRGSRRRWDRTSQTNGSASWGSV
jgi:hypothetical protein